MKRVERVSTDFEYDFIPVRVRLVVNRVRGPEFLGYLNDVQDCDSVSSAEGLTASFSSEPDVMIVYQNITHQLLDSTR